MKKLLLLISCFFLLGEFLHSELFGQEFPDPIIDYNGIPIITYIKETPEYVHADSVYKYLDTAGIFATQVLNMKSDYSTTLFSNTKFKILPDQIKDTSNLNFKNYVNRYSEAYYSKWEAEGVINPNDGDATLFYNSVIGEKLDNNAVNTKQRFPSDTTDVSGNDILIYGPYYRQEIKYAHIVDSDSPFIEFRADFRLKKLDYIGVPPPGANDTICSLKITTGRFLNNVLIDTVIAYRVITYSQLTNLYQTFPVVYNYKNVDTLFTTNRSHGRVFSDYIQFKVIWKGNPTKMSLYVDNIILSDERGRTLVDENVIAKEEIELEINEDFNGKTSGWMGLDEPQSIDQFEPMRVVQQILNDNGKSYWFAFGNNWNGKWGENQYGTYNLSQFKEFYKRVKKANFWSSRYLYTPYDSGYASHGIDWRDGQIRVQVNEIYTHFQNKANAFWGPCVQTGLYGSTTSWQVLNEIGSKELLYNVNLGLLCGAKLITFWPYFADHIQHERPTTSALVNILWAYKDHTIDQDPISYEYTDKWKTIKDTIAPRLSGPMGITLKKLTPLNQYLSVTVIPVPFSSDPHGFITDISAVNPSNGDTCIFDLGIFEDKSNSTHKYFMFLNRYYSSPVNHIFTFGINDLIGYKNWKLTDYVDKTYLTLVPSNGSASFIDSIYPGDAELYSIKPVVHYGGNILCNDSISGTQTLEPDGDPLVIKSGATLKVNGTYNIYKDITIELGGTLTVADAGSLNFYNGAKLKVYGSFTTAGSINSKTVIDFKGTVGGIYLYKPIVLSNISVRNSTAAGVLLNNSMNSYNNSAIINSEFIDCNIGIQGPGIIKFLVHNNSFSGCNTAALSFNTSSDITITSNQFLYNDGIAISMVSVTGAEIRNNTMLSCNFGIHVGSSAVNVGNNNIRLSTSNGIYVGNGSFVNMQAVLRRKPCSTTLIYYPERGYNTIWENFNIETAPGSGAEIFINYGTLLADSGSNTIYDDRFNITAFSVQNLIACQGEPTGTLQLTYNKWGDTSGIPLLNRFGGMSVNVDPIAFVPEPDISEGCNKINTISLINGPFVIDTLNPTGDGPEAFSYLGELYERENNQRSDGDLLASENTLKYIISLYLDDDECGEAFDLLYTNYLERYDPEQFAFLYDYYMSLLDVCTNEGNIDKIYHYAELCMQSEGRYGDAMASFENTISQYPGTEKADFALIDLYTAALLDTSLSLGKSFIKVNSESYISKISEILSKKLSKSEGNVKLIPTEYMLFQNYPNPFNPSTNIRYAIKDKAEVKLVVYDILGRVVKELVNEVKEPGYYDVKFNMSNFASGVYFYSLQTRNYVKTNKMLLIK